MRYEGQLAATYRDVNREPFLSNSICTNFGCELKYNDSDRSFECPCYGSRFNYQGNVLEGAESSDLKKIKF